jgi:hypothetical protein
VVTAVKHALEDWVETEPASDSTNAEARRSNIQVLDSSNLDRRSEIPVGFCDAAETRVGILQYRPDEQDVGLAIAWYGEYLQRVVDLLVQLIKPGEMVFELGPGTGIHTIPIARAVGSTGHVFLYESRDGFWEILRQNLWANETTNITVIRRTVGGVSGGKERWLGQDGDESSGELTQGRQEFDTLDGFCFERLDWLKVTNAAFADAVFNDAEHSLWRCRPKLFLSVKDANQATLISERLSVFGYRRWKMRTRLFNPNNFYRRAKDVFDDQIATSILAIPEELPATIEFDECVELR